VQRNILIIKSTHYELCLREFLFQIHLHAYKRQHSSWNASSRSVFGRIAHNEQRVTFRATVNKLLQTHVLSVVVLRILSFGTPMCGTPEASTCWMLLTVTPVPVSKNGYSRTGTNTSTNMAVMARTKLCHTPAHVMRSCLCGGREAYCCVFKCTHTKGTITTTVSPMPSIWTSSLQAYILIHCSGHGRHMDEVYDLLPHNSFLQFRYHLKTQCNKQSLLSSQFSFNVLST
jgi:hypothetical protein